MFGFVRANLEDLTNEEKERYNAFYCGLCRCLGERHGTLARMGLTYDLTFLVILLSSIYEPREQSGESRCVVHPLKKRSYTVNHFSSYAADMTIALIYYKCLDDWKDERNISKKCYASALSKSYGVVRNLWPRQCECIEKELSEITEIEEIYLPDPDAAAKSFGRLMAEVFVMEEDHWAPYLKKIGYGLGRYIYLADASVDLRKDIKRGGYNPLKSVSSDVVTETTLKVMLGEASEAFEELPLEQDLGLLRNILYSGVWIKYNRDMQKERKKAKHGK